MLRDPAGQEVTGVRRKGGAGGGLGSSVRSVGSQTALPNLRLPQSRRRREPYRARRVVHKVLEQKGENSKRVYSTSSWLRGPAMETSTRRRRTSFESAQRVTKN